MGSQSSAGRLRGQTRQTGDSMESKLILLIVIVASASGQLVDDFTCPDEFVGFYPHLISCDKYWHCQDGYADLKTCGNGLGFLDTDDTFTLEQCAELHLVECGDRTEIEPPISTTHCPRLFGTYADEEDCGIFWVCQDGKANRYDCPPGLAYDKKSRGCRWADQVPECSSNVITVDDEGSEFKCPRQTAAGIFTKHAHPADCRQYFLCIGGVPREYGCPLGTVFNVGSGTGIDGECSDPEEVPECADYYGDLEFDARELSKNGFNSRRQDNPERVRSGGDRLRNTNTIQRTSSSSSVKEAPVREVSRPAPPALQAIVDTDSEPSRVSVNPNRGRPSRPQSPSRTQFRPEPVQEKEPEQVQATLPPRLSPVRIQSFVTTPEPQTTQRTQRPSRLEIVTDRPNLRTSFRRPEPSTTVAPTSPASRFSTAGGSRFSTANRFNFGGSRFQPTQAPTTTTTTTTEPPQPTGLPDPVKAAPGPNGEEYYYYYYYYDDDEAAEEQ